MHQNAAIYNYTEIPLVVQVFYMLLCNIIKVAQEREEHHIVRILKSNANQKFQPSEFHQLLLKFFVFEGLRLFLSITNLAEEA
jgi:hypothetical protein